MLNQPLVVGLTIFAFIFTVASYFFSLKSLVQKPFFAILSWLFAFCLGMLSFSLHYAPNNPSHYSYLLAKNDSIPVIKGYISERLKPNDYNEKYFFKIQTVNSEPATGKLLLTIALDDDNSLLYPGDALALIEKPKPVTKALNPNQFDYATYMAKQNVFHQVKLKGNYVKLEQIKNFDFYKGELRRSLIRSFGKHGFSAETMNIIKALLLGQRQDINEELRTNYIDAGVIHILAISGLHIGILFYFLSIILKPLNRLKKKGKLLQLLITIVFLWSFAIITGLAASTVRAVVMLSFVSIGLYFNRNTNIFNTIAVSMLVLLLAKPNFLFDVGFQLSYAAVFAIVWMQPLYKKIRISKYKAVNYFIDIVAISFVAQLGVLPLSLYYFNQFPLLFPIANIVVIPLVTVLLIMGILTLVLNFVYTDLALLTGHILKLIIGIMNNFIKWVASFQDFVVKEISFTAPLMVSLYLIIITTILWLFKKNYKQSMALLGSVILFQCVYIGTKWYTKSKSEFIVFNDWNSNLIAYKNSNRVIFYTNDSAPEKNYNISTYSKSSFIDSTTLAPLKNMLWYNQKKILIIDSLGAYSKTMRPDILLLTHSPKINLDLVMNELKPKAVIADASNYKSYVQRWKATCRKKRIPFHATAEKGFYKVE
ncbi:competence protein ComEC [Flavobacterium suaedae]|uniref:Competence protein ComEC n=2 Tax=Flavobacterium suaedae TaxID=1767027 RepID=A0ABQ1JN55_9FLAO|nr:competence protein ComEC [Flavobacterium suaedae]